jgi:hypothetical protein
MTQLTIPDVLSKFQELGDVLRVLKVSVLCGPGQTESSHFGYKENAHELSYKLRSLPWKLYLHGELKQGDDSDGRADPRWIWVVSTEPV